MTTIIPLQSREHFLPYGMLPNGQLVHVADVPSGLACGCHCPECTGLLVARKGVVNTHHFAHHVNAECPGGGWETALHRLCKETLLASCSLMLPEAIAVLGTRQRVISDARLLIYESAREEVRLDGLIPDVIIKVGERELLVEVLVTHACGPAKITLMRQRGLACMEVDMSGVERNLTRAEHERLLLHDAPRRWLHNSRIGQTLEEMRVERDAEELVWREHRMDKAAPRLAGVWNEAPIGCFNVPSLKWQAGVAAFLRITRGRQCGMNDILHELALSADLKHTFEYVDWTPGLIERLGLQCPGFVSPVEMVGDWLQTIGVKVGNGLVDVSLLAHQTLVTIHAAERERVRGERRLGLVNTNTK